MKITSEAIHRGLSTWATDVNVKTASRRRRWLEDSDLLKLCEACKKARRPKTK